MFKAKAPEFGLSVSPHACVSTSHSNLLSQLTCGDVETLGFTASVQAVCLIIKPVRARLRVNNTLRYRLFTASLLAGVQKEIAVCESSLTHVSVFLSF